MKKEYEMPATTVVKVRTETLLGDSDGNTVHNVNGNAGLQYRGGSSTEAARGRGGNDWSDE